MNHRPVLSCDDEQKVCFCAGQMSSVFISVQNQCRLTTCTKTAHVRCKKKDVFSNKKRDAAVEKGRGDRKVIKCLHPLKVLSADGVFRSYMAYCAVTVEVLTDSSNKKVSISAWRSQTLWKSVFWRASDGFCIERSFTRRTEL